MNLLILAAALALSSAGPMFAHHSFAADYSAKAITLNGTITNFVWMNPHTRVYFDVTNSRGEVTKWQCEGSSPGGLLSNGWTRNSLKPGDRVTIEGFEAKVQQHVCKVNAVKLADGSRLPMGSAVVR